MIFLWEIGNDKCTVTTFFVIGENKVHYVSSFHWHKLLFTLCQNTLVFWREVSNNLFHRKILAYVLSMYGHTCWACMDIHAQHVCTHKSSMYVHIIWACMYIQVSRWWYCLYCDICSSELQLSVYFRSYFLSYL